MTAFVTLTLNPALDIATTTAHVQPTHKMRCDAVLRYPGGGGVNVARVLHRLGADVLAWALLGGPAGTQLAELLQAEGVPLHAQPIAGHTRENLSVLDRATAQEYRFVLLGPTVCAADVQTCLAGLLSQTQPQQWLVASGSLPPGVPTDFYAQLARVARAQAARIAVDTSGPALQAALTEGVTLAKPSLRELREATGLPLATPAEWAQATQALVQQGRAQCIALSAGEQGAVLTTAAGSWHAPALPVPAVSGTTGAGDCFLAALLWALERHPPHHALRWATAAGAAALQAPGTALAPAPDIHRLVLQVPEAVAL